jgi:hypothetical protein
VNGTTTTGGGVSWVSLVDRGLEGWLSYLNRPRDPTIGQSPWGPSASDTQMQVINAQLAAQQQNQKMLMLAAGAAAVLYLLSK